MVDGIVHQGDLDGAYKSIVSSGQVEPGDGGFRLVWDLIIGGDNIDQKTTRPRRNRKFRSDIEGQAQLSCCSTRGSQSIDPKPWKEDLIACNEVAPPDQKLVQKGVIVTKMHAAVQFDIQRVPGYRKVVGTIVSY